MGNIFGFNKCDCTFDLLRITRQNETLLQIYDCTYKNKSDYIKNVNKALDTTSISYNDYKDNLTEDIKKKKYISLTFLLKMAVLYIKSFDIEKTDVFHTNKEKIEKMDRGDSQIEMDKDLSTLKNQYKEQRTEYDHMIKLSLDNDHNKYRKYKEKYLQLKNKI